MEKEGYSVVYFVFILLIISSLTFYLFYYNNFTGFTILDIENKSEFDSGTYTNTHWNGSYVGLDFGQLNGIYTSKIFYFNSNTTWNNISFWVEKPVENRIIVVDKLSSQVWKSNDSINWHLINNDFNGISGESGERIGVDKNLIYIKDGDDIIWISNDSGYNWVEFQNNIDIEWGKIHNLDFNNVKGSVNININTNVSYQIIVCNVSDCSDGSWQDYIPGNNLNLDYIYFQFRINLTSESLNLTPKIYNITLDYDIIQETDVLAPDITLIYPYNNSGDHDGNVTYSYNVKDTNNISNCSLILDGNIILTDYSIKNNITQKFSSDNLNGSHIWGVGCYDTDGNYGISKNWSLGIIKLSQYNSINLSEENLNNITDFYLEKSEYGKINFTEALDLSSGMDIDSYVSIINNKIEIDSNVLGQLNKSAILVLYNLSFDNPVIMKDNAECSSDVCSKISYINGTLEFTVNHFTSYSASEPVSLIASSSGAGSSSGGGGGGGGNPKSEVKQEIAVESTTLQNNEISKKEDNGLLDVRVNIENKRILIGKNLIATIELFNFGRGSPIDAKVLYKITKEDKVYYEESEDLQIEVQKEFIKEFILNLEEGNYELNVELIYDKENVTSKDSFSIAKEKPKFYLVPIILITLLIVWGILFYNKKSKSK